MLRRGLLIWPDAESLRQVRTASVTPSGYHWMNSPRHTYQLGRIG
jgi:hypothetical protein